MSDATSRFALPLLAPGQAQKELFHNEALARVDAALHPVAQSIGDDDPPPAPIVGQCWIVGPAPSGDWAGEASSLAAWTEGGWRFIPPSAGMAVWLPAAGVYARFDGAGWTTGVVVADSIVVAGIAVVGAQQPAIAMPSGGSAVDVECRAATAAILTALSAHGLIAT